MNIDIKFPLLLLCTPSPEGDAIELEALRPSPLNMPAPVIASARDGVLKGFEHLEVLSARGLVPPQDEARLVMEVAQDYLDRFWAPTGVQVKLVHRYNVGALARGPRPPKPRPDPTPLTKRERQRIAFLKKKADEEWKKFE